LFYCNPIIFEIISRRFSHVFPVRWLSIHHQIKTKATYAAFAALRGDARVVSWGEAESGGDAREVQAAGAPWEGLGDVV
jgi:hypothetical protein